jgi:hypothetical protein
MQEGATKLKKAVRISSNTQEVDSEGSTNGLAYGPTPQRVVIQTTQQQSQRGVQKKELAAGNKGTSTTSERVKALGSVGAVVLSIAAFVWSVHTFGIQEKRLQAQLHLQQESLKQQRDMDSSKLFWELLPQIGCTATPQREIALELLRTNAPEKLGLALSVIEKCPAITAETAKHFETLRQQAANNEFESAFVFMVGNGKQYLLNGLPGAAARTFDTAADSIPKSYVVNHVLDLDEVTAARKAFGDGHFSEAADLFAKAYRKVPTDTGSPSGAFRRGPTFNVTNSGNQGDKR